MKSYIIQSIAKLKCEKYIFLFTLIFYILLLITNPSNYVIAFSFVILFFVYYLKTRNIFLSLFFLYVSSLIVQTGKTFPIPLIPAGVFPIEVFPEGFTAKLVITATHFISFFMFLLIIRKIVYNPQIFKPTLVDILLVVFYILKILSASLASKEPALSIPYELASFSGLIAYFYTRFFIKTSSTLWKNLSYLLGALIVFETVLAFSQLAAKSPLDRNLESQVNIEYFGHTVDETQFTFRPVGTFGHANALGIWASSVCVFLLIFCLKFKSKILWFCFVMGGILMVTTISRSAWLGFAVGLLYLIINITKQRKSMLKLLYNFVLKSRFFIIPIVLLLFIFFVIPRAQSSLYSFQHDEGAAFFRRMQTLDAIEILKLHPIFGVGSLMSVYEGISLNLYTRSMSTPLQIHNWFLCTAVDNGLLALFVFILFLILSLKNIIELRRNSISSISIPSMIVCLVVASMFQPYINITFILLLLSITNSDTIDEHKC